MASGAVTARGAGPRGQRGFTLIELLITLSVTTIGLIGLLSLHLSIARGNDGASRSAEAQQFTAARLESLRGMRLNELMFAMTNSTTLTLPAGPKTWPMQGRNGLPYSVTATVTPLPSASSSLFQIRVVTTWTEDGGTFGVTPSLDHSLALEVIRTLEDAL
jgi:prepilin-type N-terminal cleavage/methylation domain-containing protein